MRLPGEDQQREFRRRLNTLVENAKPKTIGDIASEAGISGTQIHALRNGTNKWPSTTTAKGLARALGVSRTYLLAEDEDGAPPPHDMASLHTWMRGTFFSHVEDVIQAEATRQVLEWRGRLERRLLAEIDGASDPAVPEFGQRILGSGSV